MLAQEEYSTSTIGVDALDSASDGESTRFRSILQRHIAATGLLRNQLREVLVEYLRFSQKSHLLINELITCSVDTKSPDRLDVAIDVLSQLRLAIYDYAYRFLVEDIRRWSSLYPGQAYEPNDDYWYVLLRSVSQSDISEELKLQFVSMCCEAVSRGVLEGVVEALGDIDTDKSRDRLRRFSSHRDPFIAELANEIINQD